jgi:hypothetical protein
MVPTPLIVAPVPRLAPGARVNKTARKPVPGALTAMPSSLPQLRWAFAITALVGPLAQAAPDAQDLMRKSDALHRLPAERLTATMVLQSEQGEQRSLSLELTKTHTDSEGDKTKVRFTSPAEIKDTALLSITPPGQDGEQWLYLPAFRKTRRVGGGELGDRFAGSDMFYEDLKNRAVDDFKYAYVKTEAVKGFDCHVLEGVPARPEVAKDSPYGKKQIWLRADILLPVRLRMFDRQLKPIKELTYENIKQIGPKAYEADTLTVVDVQRKHRTLVTVNERQTQPKLSPDTFSQHTLGSQ